METHTDLTLSPLAARQTSNALWYDSYTEMCANRNIPKEIIKYAKRKFNGTIPGLRQDGRVNWSEMQPWLSEHFKELQQGVYENEHNGIEASRVEWELRKLKAETIAKERANLRTDDKYIERKLVLQTMSQLATGISSLLRSRLEMELPSKCAGMGAIELKQQFTKVLNEILEKLQQPMNEWNEAKDIEANDGEATNSTEHTPTVSDTLNDSRSAQAV